MPRLDPTLQPQPASQGPIILKSAITELCRLAVGGNTIWVRKKEALFAQDPAILAVTQWQAAAEKATEHLLHSEGRGDAWMIRDAMYAWLTTKHWTLSYALESGHILLSDVADQVLQIDLVVLCMRFQRELRGDPQQTQPSKHDVDTANTIRRGAYAESKLRNSHLLDLLGGGQSSVPNANRYRFWTHLSHRTSDLNTIGASVSSGNGQAVAATLGSSLLELAEHVGDAWSYVEEQSLLSLLDIFSSEAKRLHESNDAVALVALLHTWSPRHFLHRVIFQSFAYVPDHSDDDTTPYKPAWLDEFWYHCRELPVFDPHEPIARNIAQ